MLAIYSVSYLIFNNNIQAAVNIQTQELSRQIVFNYENYVNKIISVSNLLEVGLLDEDFVDVEQINNDFQSMIKIEKAINGIAVYDTSGVCLASNDSSEIGLYISAAAPWFSSALRDKTIHVFSSLYETVNEGYYVIVSKFINYGKGNNTAILKMILDIGGIIELVKKTNLGDGGHIKIIDVNYNIVYSSIENDDNSDVETLSELILGMEKINYDNYSLMVNIDTLTNTQWRIATYVNVDQIESSRENFLLSITLILIIVIAIAMFLLTAMTNSITSPLRKLEETMLSIENSDYLKVQEINLVNGKEVANLSRSYNKMMRRIKELMDKVVIEQNEQRKSELKALQNQINPHFLYNTLDSIIWLIENDKNRDAANMVIALAKFFRISVSQSRNVGTIQNEIEHAKNYLLIQSIRYSKSFIYEFEIEETCLNYKTMKFILQPLIENAIYHGLKNRIDKGIIKIKVYMENDKLIFSVNDNGLGMRQEKIDELYENFQNPDLIDGVGLKNIYQRLLLYFSGEAELLIESELDEGTTISLILPPINE
jgi:two-component system sensor histidine kinase YesM